MSELSFEVNFNFFSLQALWFQADLQNSVYHQNHCAWKKAPNAWEDFQAICKEDAIWEEENENMFPERWSGSQSEKPQNN